MLFVFTQLYDFDLMERILCIVGEIDQVWSKKWTKLKRKPKPKSEACLKKYKVKKGQNYTSSNILPLPRERARKSREPRSTRARANLFALQCERNQTKENYAFFVV